MLFSGCQNTINNLEGIEKSWRRDKKTELEDNSVRGWFNKGPITSGDGRMDCVEPIY